jgi:sigma-E factor negative regulatory protein RseB
VQDADGVRERLYSVSGPQREVIRDRDGVRCIFSGSSGLQEKPVVADNYFPDLPSSLFDDTVSGYRLETGGEARIAGQTARRVSITPEDDFRYGYDFWLQEDTGLLLKWVLLDANHKALAKLMFTDFAIGGDVDLSELISDSPSEDFIELSKATNQDVAKLDSTPRWQPKNLPAGFQLTSHSTEGNVEHSVYSDGLAAVSVYVEEQTLKAESMSAVNQLGTNNAYSKQQGGLQITVIGEVPAITVKSIANEIALSVASN